MRRVPKINPLSVMDVGTKKWIWKTAHKNLWRVAHYFEFEDLVQEGYLQYYRILHLYPNVKDRPHLVSLFMITYINHIHDLARAYTLRNCVTNSEFNPKKDDPWAKYVRPEEVEATELVTQRHYVEGSDGPMLAMLSKSPKLLQQVFGVIMSEQGQRSLRAVYRVRKDGTRETFNDRLCRLVGVDSSQDLGGMLHEYLREAAS